MTRSGPPTAFAPDAARCPPSLAETCCDRWADGSGRLALVCPRPDAPPEDVTFDALKATSRRVAQVLRAQGVRRRDRVAILLPQGPEAVVALLAAWRIGAIAVPLARMLDGAATAFRLRHAGAVALVTDDWGLAATDALRQDLPGLRLVLGTEGAPGAVLSFWAEAGRAAAPAEDAALAPRDPAVLLHAPGPDGAVRGVLHAHGALSGQLDAVAALHGGFPVEGDRVWTPMDWAWRSGLFDALLPALAQGVPVVATAMPHFDAARALGLMARHAVRNAVLPAAALNALRAAAPQGQAGLRLRSIAACGPLPDASYAGWARECLGASLRAGIGAAECNLVLAGGEGPLAPAPGHRVAVVDAVGQPLPEGEAGVLAVARAHPGLCRGYWRDPAGSAALRAGAWVPTGRPAMLTREDAVVLLDADIPSAWAEGIGLEDVERCLHQHPAVQQAAVIGPPDAPAEDAATAIIVPRGDASPGPALAEELRDFMRASLAGHRTPRRVAFAKALPRGALGSAVGMGAPR